MDLINRTIRINLLLRYINIIRYIIRYINISARTLLIGKKNFFLIKRIILKYLDRYKLCAFVKRQD